ncbi:ATP-binding protein [Peterkaempfera griseoplana]|uniref:ATP-binding protein n=1 Tax=Peterkaempfera griseoplana TaxID=66896 RepID=UPI0006E44CA4|nr:ATP-binding protein [Peterkaempfera griseoplana]
MPAQQTTPAAVVHDAGWRFPRHPRSPGRARSALLGQAAVWRLPDGPTETAVLLLSELVTNSCRHARVPPGRYIGVRCRVVGGRLRVEVSDADAALPERRRADPDDESGRGLELLDVLAEAWGAYRRACGIGKTVWFEVGGCGLPSQRA